MSEKENDFFLGEQGLIDALGEELVAKIKKEKPELYASLRNNPIFMPSDVADDADDLKIIKD
jgi:hypothetical protein